MKLHIGAIAAVGLLLVGAGCTGTTVATNAPTATTAAAPTTATNSRLDLSGQGLEKVPDSVFKKVTLEELDLSNNKLTGALPSQIQGLKKLRVLNASKNGMTGVPAEVGQLLELQVLDLHDNKLTGLPMEIGNLQKLRIFDIRGNTISKQDLDGIRAKLPNLEILQ